MNDMAPRRGYFRKIATLWLRLIGVLFIFYGLCSIVYLAVWGSLGGTGWYTPVFYIVGGVFLWGFGPRLGRLAARDLDDSDPPSPAA